MRWATRARRTKNRESVSMPDGVRGCQSAAAGVKWWRFQVGKGGAAGMGFARRVGQEGEGGWGERDCCLGWDSISRPAGAEMAGVGRHARGGDHRKRAPKVAQTS